LSHCPAQVRNFLQASVSIQVTMCGGQLSILQTPGQVDWQYKSLGNSLEQFRLVRTNWTNAKKKIQMILGDLRWLEAVT